MDYALKNLTLESYHIDVQPFAIKVDNQDFGGFDANGIPFVDYDKINMPVKGIQYNPALVARYAIAYFEKYDISQNKNCREIFINQINWLVNNLNEKKDRDVGLWQYFFDLPSWLQKSPWVSAIAQGLGLSALSRAYQLTSDEYLFGKVKKVYNSYSLEIEEGGISHIDNNGDLWFEEYPTVPPSHVLNGFIYALFGLVDYYQVHRHPEVINLFLKGLTTLEKNLIRYDTGFWSLYDLSKRTLADTHYHHNTHIPQLTALFKITGKEVFKKTIQKWQTYEVSSYCKLKCALYNSRQRLFRKFLQLKLVTPYLQRMFRNRLTSQK
jgi:hypothetical protein